MSVRLDKFLSQSGERSRSEAVKAVRAGQVRVNGQPVRDPALKINETDTVTLAGETVGMTHSSIICSTSPQAS